MIFISAYEHQSSVFALQVITIINKIILQQLGSFGSSRSFLLQCDQARRLAFLLVILPTYKWYLLAKSEMANHRSQCPVLFCLNTFFFSFKMLAMPSLLNT